MLLEDSTCDSHLGRVERPLSRPTPARRSARPRGERLSSRAKAVVLTALVVVAATLLSAHAEAQCVDEALKQQLIGQRAYRGVVPRLIKKSLRHELSPMAGWYAGDISDGAFIWGGAYTFHFTEDLGLEASYLRTRQHYALLEAINERQQGLIDIVESEDNPIQFFLGNLVWSLAYGKVRWLGGAIGRFDFQISLGGGATVEPGALGMTGSFGFGMKFYFTEWLALRLETRDLVHAQQRVQLGVDKVVNDITALGGLSLFIPFSS
jgi:outer membrane beta-barrel protein